MADNDNCSLGLEYQHQSLPDASNYIRLLTAEAHDGDGPHILDCDLTTWRIEDSPAFTAVSYNWGDPAQTALLQINDRSLRVTKNCEVALCQATLFSAKLSGSRGPRGSDKCYFWCDAVCIGQKNQAEKEAQVAAMGRIYRRAEHVLACLGAPFEGADSTYLFRSIRSRSRLLRYIGEHWLPDGEFQLDIARMTDDKWTRMVTWFILSMPRCSIIRLCSALESLLSTPYFQRTWICQELFLGRKVFVGCGLECVQMSAIYGLAQVSTFLSSAWVIKPVDIVWGLFHPFTPKGELRRYDCQWTRYFLWLLNAGSSPSPKTRSLGSLMWKIRYQECGEIRDKVYGTLSMVRWPDDEAISVDYGRDTFDLAIQVMTVIKKRPGGWDGRWYDLAANVAQNLGLGYLPSERLADQLRRRSDNTTWSSVHDVGSRSPQESPPAGESGQHDVYWGYRLVKRDGEWAFEGQSALLPGLAEGRVTRIGTWLVDTPSGSNDGTAGDSTLDEVVLPPTARPGDWCLMHSRGRPVFQLDSQLTAMNRNLSIDRVLLVAREVLGDAEHPLSIIGKGLIHSDIAFTALEHPDAAEFKVYMADDDALLLAATSSMVEGHGYESVKTNLRTSMRTPEKGVSGYFDTSVCTGIYSSYAVKVKNRHQDE